MTGLLSNYTGRITSEYSSKPNFLATIAACCQPFVEQQATLNGFAADFTLANAVGVQLDQIGLWLNFKRVLSVPLPNVFFTWDVGGLGWDQAAWYQQYDPTTGLTTLDDDTYRSVLQLLAVYSSFNGTNQAIADYCLNLIPSLFPGVEINYKDNQNMTVTYTMGGSLPSVLVQQLFLQGYLTVKPMGNAVNYMINAQAVGNAAGIGSASAVS
jgi:hypothetical protein